MKKIILLTICICISFMLNAQVSSTVISTDVTCYGGNDGSITFANASGTTNYEYSITGGSVWQTNEYFGRLTAQTYTLIVRDFDLPTNSTVVGTIEIKQPAILEATVTITNETFAGTNNGIITISDLKGGSGVFEYSIDGISWLYTGVITGLTSGTYDVRIRDKNSPACMISVQKVIQPAGSLSADISQTTVSCYGSKTGKITISNASGGSGNYEYSVDKGVTWQASGNYTALAAGTYDVMLRDVNLPANKISLGKVNITQPQRLFATYNNYVPPLCAGGSGSITISAMGGIPPYQGTGDFTIPSGVGDVYKQYIVSDKNECMVVIIFMFSNPEKIVATGVVVPPKCFGEDGTVTVSVMGGIPPYQGIGDFKVQAGKSYSFIVKDSNGCQSNVISGLMMPNSEKLVVTGKVTKVVSNIQIKGIIDINVSGGSGIYSYKWSNGETTKEIKDLPEGTYSVEVTDSNGCMLIKSFAISIQNLSPVADAGTNQTVNERTIVSLDGSDSSDLDGDQLTYKWTAPAGITLSSVSEEKPTFKAPEVKNDSVIAFILVVNDGIIDSNPSSVNITVKNVIETGVGFLGENDLKVYPNPSAQTVWIENPEISRSWDLTILTITGERMKSYKLNAAKTEIDVSKFTPGVYFFQFENKEGRVIRKILKE